MNSRKIIVVFGGTSDERRVSVASCQNIATYLPESVLWYIAPNGRVFECNHEELARFAQPFEKDFLPKGKMLGTSIEGLLCEPENRMAVYFLALHGGEGEDGTIQHLLEVNRMGFTGSSAIASKNAFNKLEAKKIAKQAGLLIAPQAELGGLSPVEMRKRLDPMLTEFGGLILKPVMGGSSFGLYRANCTEELQNLAENIAHNPRMSYFAEAFLKGKEVTVGVYQNLGKNTALPPTEVRLAPSRSFDFDGKYLGKGAQEITPAEISPEDTRACQDAALKIHEALGCEGYSRTDFILTPTGLYFLELNTLPGLTRASFIPQQLAAANIPFQDFLLTQIQLAESKREELTAPSLVPQSKEA